MTNISVIHQYLTQSLQENIKYLKVQFLILLTKERGVKLMGRRNRQTYRKEHLISLAISLGNKKISSKIAKDIYLYRLKSKDSYSKIAEKFSVSKTIVERIISKKTWIEATKDLD